MASPGGYRPCSRPLIPLATPPSASRAWRLLRQWLAANGLDGFIVPRADEHQGEYVADRSARLKWLTGFSGSAGVAIVLGDRAFMFVDGRYTLQVRQEVDLDIFSIESLVDNPPAAWIKDNLGKGARLGFDPWLHTIGEVKALKASAEKSGAILVPLENNPIDIIWEDQPEPPLAPVEIHPIGFAGELARDKLARLAAAIGKDGATHAVLTDPSSIAWAFNIRGGDVPHTPLALGFAVLAADGSHQLFMDQRKFSRTVAAYLTQLAEPHEPGEFEPAIVALAKGGAKIALDPVLAAEKLRMWSRTMAVLSLPRPILRAFRAQPKTRPRSTALAPRIAAMARRLQSCSAGSTARNPARSTRSPSSPGWRKRAGTTGEETQMPLRDVSFDTISGAGPNGAIMHYRVSRATSRKLAGWRTVPARFRRTVSGRHHRHHPHRADRQADRGNARAFHAGAEGHDRHFHAALSCRHARLRNRRGGAAGAVEAWLRLRPRHRPRRRLLSGRCMRGRNASPGPAPKSCSPGMILSNEPGYYKEGSYGIRIENLVLVTPAEAVEGGDIAMHGFETLTLAPIDTRLVRTDLLTRDELHWLDQYHARVLAEIGPMLDGETLAWLEKATRTTAARRQDLGLMFFLPKARAGSVEIRRSPAKRSGSKHQLGVNSIERPERSVLLVP